MGKRTSRSLTEILRYQGPRVFSAKKVRRVTNLFAQRCALFYTPTENIASEWIGEGPLDVTLPIATPSFDETIELRWWETPRTWVDLLQRTSGKLRWKPIYPVRVKMIRYDSVMLPHTNAIAGTTALIDALKVRTTGRSDGRWLYYFGAIVDDSPKYLNDLQFEQKRVRRPSEARTRVIVRPLK